MRLFAWMFRGIVAATVFGVSWFVNFQRRCAGLEVGTSAVAGAAAAVSAP